MTFYGIKNPQSQQKIYNVIFKGLYTKLNDNLAYMTFKAAGQTAGVADFGCQPAYFLIS